MKFKNKCEKICSVIDDLLGLFVLIIGEVKNSAECEHPKSAAYAARSLAA